VAGAKKYKYNTKYTTNTYNTKYTPPSGVFSFPGWRLACACGLAAWGVFYLFLFVFLVPVAVVHAALCKEHRNRVYVYKS
jgi:hypothetical protein